MFFDFLKSIPASLAAVSGEITAGAIGIIGTVVGAMIVNKSSIRQERTRYLRDAYANVSACIYACIENYSDQTIAQLLTAIDRASLYCSQNVEEQLKKIRGKIRSDMVLSEIREELDKLIELEKQDLSQKHCKQRCGKVKKPRR